MTRLACLYFGIFLVSREMEAHAEVLGWIHPSRHPSRSNAVRAHGSNTCNPRMHSHGFDARWDRKRPGEDLLSTSRLLTTFVRLFQPYFSSLQEAITRSNPLIVESRFLQSRLDHKKTELRSSEQHDGISSRKFEEVITVQARSNLSATHKGICKQRRQ